MKINYTEVAEYIEKRFLTLRDIKIIGEEEDLEKVKIRISATIYDTNILVLLEFVIMHKTLILESVEVLDPNLPPADKRAALKTALYTIPPFVRLRLVGDNKIFLLDRYPIDSIYNFTFN